MATLKKNIMAAIFQRHLRLMGSVHLTAHYKERESIMPRLTQVHRDQIVGMLLVGEKQAAVQDRTIVLGHQLLQVATTLESVITQSSGD